MTLILIMVGIFFGVIAAVIARQKGRSEIRWFMAGFFFHIIGLIALFLPPVVKAGRTKKCPACAEIVKAEARVCRFCRSEIATIEESEGVIAG